MERASRLIVLVSIVLAFVAHTWLAHTQTASAVTVVLSFLVLFGLARRAPRVAVGVVAATAYSAPALLTAIFRIYDYHQLSIWLAALAGVIVAHERATGWHVPRAWKAPLVGWALVLAVTWPIVAAREVDFSLIAAGTHGVANGLAQLSPPLAAGFVILVALSQLLGLLWLDFLWQRYRADVREFARTVVLPFALGAAASSSVAIYQRLVDLDFLNLPIWTNLGRAGGLMNDANSLGMGAAIWAPLAIAAGWTGTRRYLLGIVLYAILAAGMWSAGSRTALVALTAGSVGIIIGVLRQGGLWHARIGRIAAVAAVVMFILAAAVVPRDFESGNPLKRAFDRVPRLEAAEIRRFIVEDLWLRFGYGQAAVDIVKEHPLAGVGVGAFHLVGAEYVYRARGRTIAADNAQNWWRHQIAELGLLGALPALWASVLVILMLRGEATAALAPSVAVLRGVIAGVGIASLFGVPTQHPATWLSFATAVFWLHTLIDRQDAGPAAPDSGRRWIALIVLASLVAINLSLTARGSLRPLARALAVAAPYYQGLSASEGLSDYGDFHWAARHTRAVLPVGNRWLQLTMWAPYSDVGTRQVRARVTLNDREVVTQAFDTDEAVTWFLEMPAAAKAVTLQFDVDGRVPRQRAIQTAFAWRPAPARSAAPDRLVRWPQ